MMCIIMHADKYVLYGQYFIILVNYMYVCVTVVNQNIIYIVINLNQEQVYTTHMIEIEFRSTTKWIKRKTLSGD